MKVAEPASDAWVVTAVLLFFLLLFGSFAFRAADRESEVLDESSATLHLNLIRLSRTWLNTDPIIDG